MADHRSGGKRRGVIAALAAVAGLQRGESQSRAEEGDEFNPAALSISETSSRRTYMQEVIYGFTCPGKTPDTGVEPPEWLGELGRDLQEASKAACFLAAMIFWAAVEWKFKGKKRKKSLNPALKTEKNITQIYAHTPSLKTLFTLRP